MKHKGPAAGPLPGKRSAAVTVDDSYIDKLRNRIRHAKSR